MDRSRSSKRSYHHYDHDSDSQTPPPRSKPRFNNHNPNRNNNNNRHFNRNNNPDPPPASPSIPTTVFRILCPDSKAGAIIGKSGTIIKSIRNHTDSWINVLPLIPGDEERVIETSDNRRREDNRPLHYSPAQEALLMVHDRILEVEFEDYGTAGELEEDRVTTRLVVPKLHVGCLLGKGGKIIEQMRMETKTHIRILPRDQYTPHCVSNAEEIVQIVGETICVKKAVAIISSRLKESLHRDRGPFRGRLQSPEHYFPDDEFMSNAHPQSAMEGPDTGPRFSSGQNRVRNNVYGSRPSGYAFDSDAGPMPDHSQAFPCEDLVFRILCPNDKVENVMGVSDGIIEMLQTDVGVEVRVSDLVPGSSERVIIITSEEGPDDDLFPAQEALLHVQTHIVDLGPDKDNIITTRLLVRASEIGCFEGGDSLSDIQRLTNANVQILPKEDLPLCRLETDELIQIAGEIRAARSALVQVTAMLRSYMYRDISIPKDIHILPPSTCAPSHAVDSAGLESNSVRISPHEGYQGNETPMSVSQNMQPASIPCQPKDNGDSASASYDQKESTASDEGRQSAPKRFSAPLVTRSTLEVVIPEYAISSLTMRAGSKLAQISEMSGATVSLIEDQSEQTEKIVKISGTPEQAERAQSLLQGFILSTQDDIP